MGRILKVQKLTTLAEGLIVALGAILVMTVVYFVSPGLRVEVSKLGEALQMDKNLVDNVSSGDKLPLPSESVSNQVADKGLIRIAEYAWNGNSGMIVANGGPITTEGSLMESAGIRLNIVREDMVGGLRNMQIKFVEEFAKGAQYPVSDKSAVGVSIMGDGVPFYVTTTQKAIDEKFDGTENEGKYHLVVVGAYGLSYGEDKLIGPKAWKENPQLMKGCLISSVIGDGDWVLACNYAFANGIKVNPDPTTYDADAINFVGSKDDDYINSVKELISSPKIKLDVVKDGKKTGKQIEKKIDGATTWTPGDKLAFDALSGYTDVVSTKDFVNQMATTLVLVREWADTHKKEVIELLKQTYIASNQIKQYDEWARKAADCVAKTYNLESGDYWYKMFKGQKGSKDGVDFNIGGTRVFNYADAKQYYGVTDGNNRYKAVYDQVSSYLMDLNPCNFKSTCPNGVLKYEDVVDVSFLVNADPNDKSKIDKISYTDNKSTVMANGQWNINFQTGSATISGSTRDLETIYNLLIQAEETKLNVVGYTDNVGISSKNVVLSKNRAQSVVAYLTGRGISQDRFQLVDGRGDANPVGDNNTASGKAKNRRVEITLLK